MNKQGDGDVTLSFDAFLHGVGHLSPEDGPMPEKGRRVLLPVPSSNLWLMNRVINLLNLYPADVLLSDLSVMGTYSDNSCTIFLGEHEGVPYLLSDPDGIIRIPVGEEHAASTYALPDWQKFFFTIALLNRDPVVQVKSIADVLLKLRHLITNPRFALDAADELRNSEQTALVSPRTSGGRIMTTDDSCYRLVPFIQ